MTEIIIIPLLVLILCEAVVRDLLLLKIVAKARAEPGKAPGGVLGAVVNAINKHKTESWHERWEKK